MTIQPVVRSAPAYPGATARRTLLSVFRSLMTSRITLTGCFCFLLQCSVVLTAIPAAAQTSAPPPKTPTVEDTGPVCQGKVSTTFEAVPEPPCAGAPVAPVEPPPPCMGEIAVPEPPCKGDAYVPPPPSRPPERIPGEPVEVTLEELHQRPRDYLAMNVRVEGTLGQMPADRLVDRGYYLFLKSPTANARGEMYALPLVGDCSAYPLGSSVVIEGTLTRRDGGPGEGDTPQTYFVVRIERIHSGRR